MQRQSRKNFMVICSAFLRLFETFIHKLVGKWQYGVSCAVVRHSLAIEEVGHSIRVYSDVSPSQPAIHLLLRNQPYITLAWINKNIGKIISEWQMEYTKSELERSFYSKKLVEIILPNINVLPIKTGYLGLMVIVHMMVLNCWTCRLNCSLGRDIMYANGVIRNVTDTGQYISAYSPYNNPSIKN